MDAWRQNHCHTNKFGNVEQEDHGSDRDYCHAGFDDGKG